MGRAGIEFEDVVGAIEVLQHQRLPVTQERIRLLLGAGSYTTIGKHLQRWRHQQPKQSQQTESLAESLAEPPDPIQATVRSIWQQLQTTAEEQIQAIQVETAQQVQAAQAKQAQAEQALQELEQASNGIIEQLQEKYVALQQLSSELQQTCQAREQQCEQLEQKVMTLEKAQKQAANDHHAQVESLKAEHQQREQVLHDRCQQLQLGQMQLVATHKEQQLTMQSVLLVVQKRAKRQRRRLIGWLARQRDWFADQRQKTLLQVEKHSLVQQHYQQALVVIGKLETNCRSFQQQALRLECMLAAIKEDRMSRVTSVIHQHSICQDQ